MTTRGRIKLSTIARMLENCASGAELIPKKHRIWVHWNSRTYRGLPKGSHGSKDPEIERGHVRHMVRFFDLDPACVQQHLRQR